MTRRHTNAQLFEITRDVAGRIEAKQGTDYTVTTEGEGLRMDFFNHWRGFGPDQLKAITSIAAFGGLVIRDNCLCLYFS